MINKILSMLVFDDSRTLILNICTMIGAFGGMPDPPIAFKNAFNKFPFIKWILLAVLIYQGGGEQNVQLAVELTVICFLVFFAINQVTKNSDYPQFSKDDCEEDCNTAPKLL